MEGAPHTPAVPARLRTFVRWMDEAVRVPGTSFRVGLDGLLGLAPGVGDAVGGILSLWTLVSAARLGASAPVLFRMGLNLAVDALVGTVPFLGDVFDLGWKANRRNLDLLERHLAEPRRARRSSLLVLAVVVGGVLLALGLALVGAVALVRWLAVPAA